MNRKERNAIKLFKKKYGLVRRAPELISPEWEAYVEGGPYDNPSPPRKAQEAAVDATPATSEPLTGETRPRSLLRGPGR